MVQMLSVVNDLCGTEMEVEVNTGQYESPNGRYPLLKTADGNIVFEVEAIAKYIARMNPKANLLGKSPFVEAQINQWLTWTQTTWSKAVHPALFAVYGIGRPCVPAEFSAYIKEMKTIAKVLDTHLKGKQWIAGDNFSLADLYCGAFFSASFQTVLDAGFRKAMPNLAAWFANFAAH